MITVAILEFWSVLKKLQAWVNMQERYKKPAFRKSHGQDRNTLHKRLEIIGFDITIGRLFQDGETTFFWRFVLQFGLPVFQEICLGDLLGFCIDFIEEERRQELWNMANFGTDCFEILWSKRFARIDAENLVDCFLKRHLNWHRDETTYILLIDGLGSQRLSSWEEELRYGHVRHRSSKLLFRRRNVLSSRLRRITTRTLIAFSRISSIQFI